MTPERKAYLRRVHHAPGLMYSEREELFRELDAAESRATRAEAQKDRLVEALRAVARQAAPFAPHDVEECARIARAALTAATSSDGSAAMNCPCCKGSGPLSWGLLRNEELFLASRLISARTALRELEKLARSTPPRHLVEARRRVSEAQARLDVERARIAADEERFSEVRSLRLRSEQVENLFDA